MRIVKLYASDVIVVVLLLILAGTGYFLYTQFYPHPGQTTSSENWAGYTDRQSVGWASGVITLPSPSSWNGSGTVSLWVGMGGSNRAGIAQWPFWQAGVSMSCDPSGCSAILFDEGGTQGPPCDGTCPVDWTQSIGYDAGTIVTIRVAGGSAGSTAVLTVKQDGVTTTYDPPSWTVLAGVSEFPYAEWVLESPITSSGATAVMPTLASPGIPYSSINDSAGITNVGPIQMEGNPNGQSVGLSSWMGAEFWAYPYDT